MDNEQGAGLDYNDYGSQRGGGEFGGSYSMAQLGEGEGDGDGEGQEGGIRAILQSGSHE